jgi:hypothetical protein
MNYLRSMQTDIAGTDASTKGDPNRGKRIATYIAFASLAIVISSILPEIALAGKFDIDAGVKAATDPLIKAIDDHWGKAVVLTGCGGAVIGEGDARQRAVRAGIAATAAGGVVLALLAMLT